MKNCPELHYDWSLHNKHSQKFFSRSRFSEFDNNIPTFLPLICWMCLVFLSVVVNGTAEGILFCYFS